MKFTQIHTYSSDTYIPFETPCQEVCKKIWICPECEREARETFAVWSRSLSVFGSLRPGPHRQWQSPPPTYLQLGSSLDSVVWAAQAFTLERSFLPRQVRRWAERVFPSQAFTLRVPEDCRPTYHPRCLTYICFPKRGSWYLGCHAGKAWWVHIVGPAQLRIGGSLAPQQLFHVFTVIWADFSPQFQEIYMCVHRYMDQRTL